MSDIQNTQTELKVSDTQITQTELKIAVLNYAGGVGKTTVVNNLLKPRMQGTPVIAIETINEDGGDTQIKIKGKEYGLLQDELLMNDRLIIDIGASNIEETMRMMSQYKGSHEDFNYFILPVVPDGKEQIDTISAISALRMMGVPAKKIKVVFNKVDDIEKIEEDFHLIIAFLQKVKMPIPEIGIEKNEVYDELRHRKHSISELLNMTDLRDQLRQAKDRNEKKSIANIIGLQRLATTANNNLDEVFKELSL